MLKFCDKNKGAISVFLTLILLPTLLLGGLTSDAARIYASKVVISDAGEMAMNAALAQYDAELMDQYGLFMMEKKPSQMESELEGYFNISLNGTGIAGAEDYQKILDLVTEQFEVIELEGTQIYKTEVEKQQIIEYMKYRAPVCLTELVLEKLDQLNDVKAMADAMDAQLEFAKAMEDCQEAMEKAKEALDNLDTHIKEYQVLLLGMQTTLDETELMYKSEISKGLLMRSAISKYNESADIEDGESAAKSYIQAADGISLGTPIDGNSFESYLNAKYYEESAKKLREVISDHRAAKPAAESPEYDAWKSRMEELEELESSYNEAKATVSQYPNALLSTINTMIQYYTLELAGYFQKSVKGQDLAEEAQGHMEVIKEKLENAQDKWEIWEDKTSDLGSNAGEMQESVDQYGEFFGSTTSEDVSNLDDLLLILTDDVTYFQSMQETLKKEKFHGQSIATVTADSQYSVYYGKANGLTSSSTNSYSAIIGLLDSYTSSYEHVRIPESPVLNPIDGKPFYERLKEYCKEQETANSEANKEETNSKLDEGKDSSKEANKEDGYPTTVLTITSDCPSKLLSMESREGKDTEELGGDVNGRSGRRKALNGYQNTIRAASDFLTNLESILTEGVANLYVAEYAMQMFSYYTVDKKFEGGTVTDLQEDEIISLSGYKLKDNVGYKGEVEYILWGNPKLANNIKSTVAMIFGIRLLLNSFFAFTDNALVRSATEMATTIAGAAPYLIPVLQVVIQLGFAAAETSVDVKEIKEGYGITLIKSKESWQTINTGGPLNIRNNNSGITFDYSEYLRVFVNLNMFGNKEKTKLARIGDCIQLNTEKMLQDGYTMVGIESKVKSRTTFMKKISDMGYGLWSSPDNTYTIQYQSILGY